MKILVLQDRLRSGGTERQTILLTRAFREAGHDARIVTFRPGGALWGSAQDLPGHALQRWDMGLDWFAPGLSRTVHRFSPDVVLCMGRMANCYGGWLHRRFAKYRLRVVGTMRTGKPLPRFYRTSLQRVDQVVANSHDAAQALQRDYAVAADRIRVIHNALVFPPPPDTSHGHAPGRATTRLKLDVTALQRVCLCVGMFRPEKNQRELLEIVAPLPRDGSWALWLVGDGPELPACRALAQKLGLPDPLVKFLGFQNDPSPLYAAADLAVLTSKSESLSNFLIEGQAHGLPAVAYDAMGVGEAFLPGQTGTLIRTGDQAAFRAALLDLISDPKKRVAQSGAARRHAREAFSPKTQASAYLRLFETLLPTGPA